MPGATSDPGQVSDSPGSFGYFSINGNRGRANNYLLDGTDMNDGYRNDPAINEAGVFGTPATILPVDAVETFPVLSGAEAEYGRNAGAIVNIVTKSGTNEVHGGAFEYFRNDALGARNFFNTAPLPKNEFRNNQFGASLGGPLVKDKTFFFVAYEGQREKGGLPSFAHVPTAAEIAAAQANNGGVINPVIANLLARNPWPAPNMTPDPNGNDVQATTRFTNDVDSVIAKLDHHFADADLLTVRYFYGHSDQSFPLALVGGGGLPGYNTVTPTTVNLASASLTHVISPKLLLELRGGYNRFYETFSPEDGGFDPRTIGLGTVSDPRDSGLPLISVSGYATIGANVSVPRGRTDQNYQAFANLSYNTGSHSMKLGYEFRRTTVSQYFDAGYRGKLSFDSLDDFVAGRVTGGRQAQGNSDRDTYQSSHGLYFQDSFRISPRVTLNYGVRWDYYGVVGEKDGKFSIFDTAGGTVRPVTQLYPKDFNNVSPRVSVAWDTRGDGKTVFRAGWGLYYDRYRDVNQLEPPSTTHPFPDFLYINQFKSSASSHYNAAQASLKIRGWHGLDSTMNYTLSKCIDNASDGQDYVPNATQPDDSYHPERERAPCNFDSRHRFTWFFTWAIGKQKGNWLTAGWALDGVVTVASGQPFNIKENFEGDHNGTGEFFGRPDLVGDPFAGTGGPDHFLNLAAFKAPCDPDGEGGCSGGQHIGSLGRKAFSGPSNKNADLALVKNTWLSDRVRLQIRADVFNVFNHPNFSNPLLPNFIVDYLQNGIDPATNRGVGFLPLTATPDVGTGNPFLGGGSPRSPQIAARLSF